MDKYFINRRSVRNFTDRPVESSLLNEILTAAAKAPTCGNMQLYSVIVTRSPQRKAELAKQHFSQPATNAPVILTICADFNRFTRWCQLNNADAGFDNLESFISATADAIILAQQITTIAEQEGLGTCYLGTVTYNAPEIAGILNLPELVVPVACLALGWPDGPGIETERLPLEAFVHEETYRNDSDQEIISLFKSKEQYPANIQFVKENNKDNLAQVFAEIRYPRAMNEAFSQKLKDYLQSAGFLK
ncbi:MAG: nitroreductase family protein [Muribaculaceae bacterium]|nr:nitroreductase family protein [Muribaculaceae bacterium]